MRSVAFFLAFASLSASAAVTTRNLTVVVDFERPHSDVSFAALREKLQDLLAPAGIVPHLMLRSNLAANPQFSELVVFEMKGFCSMNRAATTQPLEPSLPGNALASAYTSDGEILHFGAVECDRVRQCLERITKGRYPEQHQKEYGAALGIVVAHEIYHMLAGAKRHTSNGLTKASLSAQEILNTQLALSDVARQALRR